MVWEAAGDPHLHSSAPCTEHLQDTRATGTEVLQAAGSQSTGGRSAVEELWLQTDSGRVHYRPSLAFALLHSAKILWLILDLWK